MLVVGFFVPSILDNSTVLVEQMPCIFTLMCPFCVSSDSGKNLVVFLMLMGGQVR